MAKLNFVIALWPTIIAAAYVQSNYPLSLQLPPVAHVGTPYQFQFASTTFQSDATKLQYSLTGNPSWLSVDVNNRTLSGTPKASDVGEISFTISAAGAAGAVANMQAKLLVTSTDAPTLKANTTQVLSGAGQVSAPTIISIGPSKPFSITFPSDTFTSDGKSLSYFSLLSDRTPLPAWIGFDATTMRFFGNTPPITSPQSFEIVLIASDTPGYTAASTSFTLAVSPHQLVFEPFSQNVSLKKGDNVDIADIRSKLTLDGAAVKDSDLQSVTANVPSWMKFDNKTLSISGTAPSDLMSQNVTVTAKDQFGDVAKFSLHIDFKSELFASEFGPLNLTIGEKINYQVPKSILSKGDGSLTIDFSSLSDYLKFNSTSFTITGEIPTSFKGQDVQCSLTAISGDGNIKDTQKFQVAAVEATEGSSKTSSAQPADHPSMAESEKESNRKKAGVIIASVLGAILGLIGLVALAFCLRRRKRKQSYLNPKPPRSPRKSAIGRPKFMPLGWPDIDIADYRDLEEGRDEKEPATKRTPEHPPKIDLELLADRRDSHSLADSIGDADTRILDSFHESSFGIQDEIAPSQHPHGSMKIPTELAKRASQKSDTYRKHKRQTTTIYQDQIHRRSGLPVNRRITGMGHGRHTYSASRSNTNLQRPMIRRPLSTSSYTTTRCTSTISTVPSAFPQPPITRKHRTMVTTPTEDRRSIRIVPASIRGSPAPDGRTMDEKRNSYIRKRASAQSPFFSANGSRVSSTNYKSPPAFIAEAQSSPRNALSPTSANVIVRPNDDVVEGRGKELPRALEIRKASASPIRVKSARDFPGSLRQNRINRPVTSLGSKRDRVEKSYARRDSGEASKSNMRRRASTRESFRAYDLKTSLNNLTGSEIFKDAELSDSVYTDEEEDIKEAERQTIKPDQFALLPLNVDTRRRSKRSSAEKQKKTSKRNSKRELKRTSDRDPTPYSFPMEHGGKENESSTYTLGTRSSPVRNVMNRKTIATSSPQRPKLVTRLPRPVSDARKARQSTLNQASGALTREESTKERHSRKSIHSRNQSRHSSNLKKRDHSRTQSTAYPFFDAASIDMKRSSIGNAITTAADAVCMPDSDTKPSLITRDLSGNITFYHGSDEEPTIEELGSSSIAFRTSNGQISPIARQSRLASLHESSQFSPSPPRKSSKRETAFKISHNNQTSSPTATRSGPGLGLFPVDTRAELCAGDYRERTPLSTVAGGENRDLGTPTPEPEEGGKGRQTWGSLKSIMGRGSRWVSTGYWDKQGKDDKIFI